MEKAIRQAAERHFQGQDCAVNCVAVAQLRGRFNMIMWICGLLLTALIAMQGANLGLVLGMNKEISLVVAKTSAVEAKQLADMKAVSDRLDVHRGELTTIENWHIQKRDK